MTKLKKFTSLDQDRIRRIESILSPELLFITKTSKDLIENNERYQVLIGAFCEAEDKKEFFDTNSEIVAEFLNKCKLIGYKEESGPDGNSFIIGAEGVALVSAYLSVKDKNTGAHPVETVKNINLITSDGSRKHSNIFLEQQQVHDGFRNKLTADLRTVGDAEFHKTYLIEAFGTTGGNHFVCVSIHKREEEKDPVVYLFDPSPALVRNGIEAQKNSIANGWCSQLIVNATLKKSLEESGLIFSAEKYYSNSEPLQKAGSSLCATFAYEMAHEISRIDPKEHRKILEERYKYRSPLGGKTEIPINLEEIERDGYVMHPSLGLRGEDVAMSHFVDTAIIPRADELMTASHTKKDGSSETILARIARYSAEEDGRNQIVEQKVLRQKIGHLFEIVTNEAFLRRADEAMEMLPLPEIEGSPYFPKDSDLEKFHPETAQLVSAFNKLMPRFNRANCSSFDEESGQCKISVYLGDATGAKLLQFMQENNIEATSTSINFADNLMGVDPRFSQLQRITTNIPRAKFEEMTVKMSEKGSLYKAADHPFMPPKATLPITLESLASLGGIGHERK